MLDTPPLPAAQPAIIVTASRLPETRDTTPATVSVIDRLSIERLGSPFVSDFLRLLPSAAVATSGPAGSLTEVRIRGAEANHTLLFIDGIRANDPAAGNTPRFELLNADIASRIELVRGPQSALWGSEAIGGVVSVEGDPARDTSASMLAEAGSFATVRGAAAASYSGTDVSAALALAGQKSRGTDAFDGNGDRDGYSNLSARGRLTWQAGPSLELGATGFATRGRSEFDGYSPVTFLHADTLDNSRNRLTAVRTWVRGSDEERLAGTLSASWLGSSNRNLLDRTEVNRTRAERRTISGELRHHLRLGEVDQRLVVAVEQEEEKFHARDVAYGGATNQDRTRRHRSVTAQSRTSWRGLTGDIAVRRDTFNRFRDATTVRASILARLGGGVEATASYGEGIAQPTFFDLYGFFPNSFSGNPQLTPESSRGYEAALRWHRAAWRVTLTVYRQRLRDEIVDVSDPVTFRSTTVNAIGRSRRQGVEAEASWTRSSALRITAQSSYLDASDPGTTPGRQLRETRRPKWSGALLADGTSGRFNYGGSIAYAGARTDVDFDRFPAERVRLGAYWLASARIGWRMTGNVELFARVANAFDRSYREAVGYRPSGRSIDGGLRLALGR